MGAWMLSVRSQVLGGRHHGGSPCVVVRMTHRFWLRESDFALVDVPWRSCFHEVESVYHRLLTQILRLRELLNTLAGVCSIQLLALGPLGRVFWVFLDLDGIVPLAWLWIFVNIIIKMIVYIYCREQAIIHVENWLVKVFWRFLLPIFNFFHRKIIPWVLRRNVDCVTSMREVQICHIGEPIDIQRYSSGVERWAQWIL